MKRLSIGSLEVGAGRLFVIAGPCVVESEAVCLETARKLESACRARGLPFIFKSSYRKANRSSAGSYTGPGMKEGLDVLRRVQTEVGVPVLTDVHETGEVAAAAAVADVLQIPAFLCRQTELLVAAGKSGRAVNVKKGQFLAPPDMKNVVEKLTGAGCERILLTERGTTFGYGNLVVDMRSFPIMKALGWPVVYDATHSLQTPGGETTGGDRRFAHPLMRAALAAGADGLFFEAHPNPEKALSDSATQLPLADVEAFLDDAVRTYEAVTERAHA